METYDPQRPAQIPGDPRASEQGSTMTSTTERATETAREVRGEVAGVAHDAAEQVAAVAHEATAGVRDVVDEARHAVHDEADRQTHTVAQSMQRLAGDLRSMADRSEEATAAADYVGRIGRSLDDVARRLEQGGVDGALDEARTIARRHPGMFLAGSALGGFALARVMRHAAAPQSSSPGPESATGEVGPGQGQLTEYGRSQLRAPDATSTRDEDIDLRQDFERRPGDAPQLRDDMQEWVRP